MKKQFLILLALTFACFVSFGQTNFYNGIKVGKKASTTVAKIDSISYQNSTLKIYRGATNVLPSAVDTTHLSERIDGVEEIVYDTITLQSAITNLSYITLPSGTTTEINALTSMPEGTMIYDETLHVFKFWNGSVWKTITTN